MENKRSIDGMGLPLSIRDPIQFPEVQFPVEDGGKRRLRHRGETTAIFCKRERQQSAQAIKPPGSWTPLGETGREGVGGGPGRVD